MKPIITHLLDASALPDSGRYFYLDEQPGGGGGPTHGSVVPTRVAIPSTGIAPGDRYAIQYFEAPVPAGTQCQGVGFRGARKEMKEDES
jgi:hypothetical protein